MSGRGRVSSRSPAALRGDPKARCGFCNDSTEDEATLGRMYELGPLVCHYYCVLLSCCLVQRGKDEEGLFGFLLADIQAEIQRGKKYKCSYCGKSGATIGCCDSKCKKQFHLPCGRRHGSKALFFGNYKSYCVAHTPQQRVPESILVKARARQLLETGSSTPAAKRGRHRFKEVEAVRSPIKSRLETLTEDVGESVCAICYERVRAWPAADTFWPPCCARDSWLHLACLQRMALSAGAHYFKCPLCNDKETFHEAVLEHGVYVPDRDAAWELETDAFADMYARALACGAADCRCHQGREYDADYGLWELKACLLCGGAAAHRGCLRAERHVCADCGSVAPPDDLAALDDMPDATQRSRSPVWRPVMPSRMSVRRTKRRRRSPHRSRGAVVVRQQQAAVCETPAEIERSEPKAKETTRFSRLSLGLKSPRASGRQGFGGGARTEWLEGEISPQKEGKEQTSSQTGGKENTSPQKAPKEQMSPENLWPTAVDTGRERVALKMCELDQRLLSPLKLLTELGSPRRRDALEASLLRSGSVVRRPGPLNVKKKIVSGLVHEILSDWRRENAARMISAKAAPERNLDLVDHKKSNPEYSSCQQESYDPMGCNTLSKDVVSEAVKSSQNGNDITASTTDLDFVADDVENVSGFMTHVNNDTDSLKEKECFIENESVVAKASEKGLELPLLNEKDLDSALAAINVTKQVTIDLSSDSQGCNVSYKKADVGRSKIKTRKRVSDKNDSAEDMKSGRSYNLESHKINKKLCPVDLEAFKSQYLSEIEPSTSYKCSYDHNHSASSRSMPKRLRTAIDWAIDAVIEKKRKYTENVSQPSEKDVTCVEEPGVLEKYVDSNNALTGVYLISDDEKGVFAPKAACHIDLKEKSCDNINVHKIRKCTKGKNKTEAIVSTESTGSLVLRKITEEHDLLSNMPKVAPKKDEPQKSFIENDLSLKTNEDEKYKNIRAYKIPKKRKDDDGIVETGKRSKTREEKRSEIDDKSKVDFEGDRKFNEDRSGKAKKHKRRKRADNCETEISFNRRHLNLKIKWQEQRFNVQIEKVDGSRHLKQTLLNFSPENNEVLLASDEVSLKRKRSNNGVSPDGLKQTSISSFFTRK